MKQLIFIKNAPIDEKRIGFIETILSRLSRRVHKVTTAIIPPHIISKCAFGEDVRGDILKVMLFKGKLTKGIICFDKKPKKPIKIDVKILNGQVGYTDSFYIDKIRYASDLDILTIDGSMITISVYPVDEEEKVTEVWVSLLWEPDMSNAKIERRMIESLEKAADGNLIEK